MSSRGTRRLLAAAAWLACLQPAAAGDGDRFFDSRLDGVWVGTIELRAEGGKVHYPLVLNVDAAGSTGVGFALLPDRLRGRPAGYDALRLRGVTVSGTRITFTVETTAAQGVAAVGAAVHRFALRFRPPSDLLRGTFTSTDAELGRGKVVLHRASGGKPLQQVWVGSFRRGRRKTLAVLQFVQGNSGGRDPAAASALAGFGIVDDIFGPLRNAVLSDGKITGVVAGRTATAEFDLRLAQGRLKGTLRGPGFTRTISLAPAGTKGRRTRIQSVSPTELRAGQTTVVTVRGRNLAPGFVVHFDQGVRATRLDFVNQRSVRVQVFVPDGVADGTRVSMRFVHPDNQRVDRLELFEVTTDEEPTVSFSGDIQPVFNTSCALSGCHAGRSPAQGMDLSEGVSYDNIVNVRSRQVPSLFRIEPRNPDDSYLIRKIKGQGIVGGRMPLNRPPLSDEVIQKFVTWVEEGALRN